MVLRLTSGSVTPAKAERNSLEASTPLILSPIPLYCSKTLWNSPLRKSPLLTKIQCNWLPIALFSNTAATVESTPPERPNTTFSLPTCALSAATVVSIKLSGVQDGVSLAILKRKFDKSCFPSVE